MRIYATNKYLKSMSRSLLGGLFSDVTAGNKNHMRYKFVCSGIEHYKPIQSQFLYLLLLSKSFPFLARKHPSKKKYRFAQNKHDVAKISVYPNQSCGAKLFHKFKGEIMREQLSPEFPAVVFSDNYTKIIAWNAPLYGETFCVQTSETLFISDIPVYLKFYTAQNILKECSFWLHLLSFLKKNYDWYSTCNLIEYSYIE